MEAITIKEEAAEQIDKLFSQEEERPYALRIFIVGGGCSGFEYGFSFEEDGKQNDDLEFETNGVKMLCYDCKLNNEEIRINNQIYYEE